MKKTIRLFTTLQLVAAFLSLKAADISSRHFLLTEGMWEVSPGLVDIKRQEDFKINSFPLRYGITENLEFIPFGIKYRVYKSKTDQFALMTFLSDIDYTDYKGWEYGTSFGFAWRNTEIKQIRIDLASYFSQIHSEISRTTYYTIPLKITYRYSKKLEFGAATTLYRGNESFDYRDVKITDYINTKHITTLQHGIYIYYYFTENFNIKTGIYTLERRETQEDDNGVTKNISKNYNAYLYRIDWRF